MTLLTVADRCRHHFPAFVESAERFHIQAGLLGWGWPWQGLGSKPKLLYQHLRNLKEPRGTILFTDSQDAFLVEPLSEIERRFRAFRHPCVMSAETNCAPNADLADHYPPTTTRYRFLNSGGFVAETAYLLGLLERWKVWRLDDHANDQGWFTERFLAERDAIRLDTGCSIFQCLYGAESDLHRKDGRIFNRATRTFPAVFHGNGRSDMRRLLEWARLDAEPYRNPISV